MLKQIKEKKKKFSVKIYAKNIKYLHGGEKLDIFTDVTAIPNITSKTKIIKLHVIKASYKNKEEHRENTENYDKKYQLREDLRQAYTGNKDNRFIN